MIRFAILAWGHPNGRFKAVQPAVWLGRLLLLVVAIELITMPITQDLWSWDKFLHGGQDFELGLLVIVTCLCLILLRTQQGKRTLGLLMMRTSLFKARIPAALLLIAGAQRCDRRPRIPRDLLAASLRVPLLT